MELTVNAVNDVVVATPSDELDMLGHQKLSEEIDKLIHAGKKKIVVDLSGVSYINVASCNALALLTEKAAKAGGRLVLAGASGGARTVLDASGVTKRVTLHAALAAAIAAVGP
jgi:anti-sigma B factor antagonist